MKKFVGRQIRRRTKAMASEEVGWLLTYQAACRTGKVPRRAKRWASRMTIENKPNNTGVVRAIAQSDHCRWVSIPR